MDEEMTRTVLLGELVSIRSGKSRPKEEGKYPVYGGNGVFDSAPIPNMEKSAVIVGRVGAYCGSVYLENSPFWLSDNALGITAKEGVILEYIYYLLKSIDLNKKSVGGAQPLLTQGILNSIPVSIPAIETQKKIADILGTIDEKIELNRKMNETLEEMGQALFRHYFIDNPDAEKWEDVPVRHLIESALGGDWGKDAKDSQHIKQTRVIRGTDMDGIKNGNIDSVPIRFVEEKRYKTRRLRPGDILIEISGGSNSQSTGRSLYIDNNTLDLLGGSAIPASFCRVIRTSSQEKACVLFTFLEYLYSKGAMWDYQNRSTGISNFQFKYFTKNALIKNVSTSVESIFYDNVQPLITQRAENAEQIQTLTTLRDTLLPRLINGKAKV